MKRIIGDLRQEAEKVAETAGKLPRKALENIDSLLYELEVHQAELEIQNEELRNIQLELRESRDRYLNLYEYAPIGYFTLDRDSHILEVNLTGAVMLGKPRGRLLRTKFTRFVAHDSQDIFYFHVRKVLETGQRQNCELQLRKRDGALANVLVSSTARPDAEGNLPRCFSIITDITKERQSEASGESEQQYRALFENMIDGYAYCRMIFEHNQPRDFIYLDVNKSFEKLTGLKEVIGKKVTEVIPGIRESNPELFEIYGRVALTCQPERFETFVEPLKIWFSVSVYSPVRGTFTAVFENITARKKAEEGLKRDEVRLESLLEISNYEVGSIQQLLDFALKKAISLTGSKIGYIYHYDEQKEQFTLNTWSKEVMDECKIASPQTVYQLNKTGIWGEVVRQRKPIIVNNFQAQNPLKKGYPQGHARLYSFLTVPVFVDERIVAVVGVANKDTDYEQADIRQLTLLTDSIWKIVGRKRAEKALQESEQRFRAMFEGHNAVMLMIEPESGRIVDANPGAAAFYGYSREVLRRMNINDINQSPPDQVAVERRKAMIRQSTHFIFLHKISNGEVRTVEAHSTPINIHNQPVLFSIIQDITDRKLSEEKIKDLNASLLRRTAELEAANKELEAFSYSVSHDLRAPLRSIEGFSQAVLEDYSDKLDPQGQEYLQRIRTSSRLMAQLIDDILNLSRITRTEIYLDKVDLSKLAQEVAADLKRLYPERQVEFNIASGLEAYGDSHLLKLVFDNLLGNAFKFTGKRPLGEIEFGVTQYNGEPAFFVRDNGAGFDMAYADNLFKPFQRLHSKEEFPGTGIGLASVQNIIRRSGGKVWAEGQKDKGATFYFTLQQISP